MSAPDSIPAIIEEAHRLLTAAVRELTFEWDDAGRDRMETMLREALRQRAPDHALAVDFAWEGKKITLKPQNLFSALIVHGVPVALAYRAIGERSLQLGGIIFEFHHEDGTLTRRMEQPIDTIELSFKLQDDDGPCFDGGCDR